MKLRKTAILLMVLMTLMLVCGCADISEFICAGVVMDRATLEGIPGATITIKIHTIGDTYTQQIETNHVGAFALDIQARNLRRLEFIIEADGYQPLAVGVAVIPEDSLALTFMLEKL